MKFGRFLEQFGSREEGRNCLNRTYSGDSRMIREGWQHWIGVGPTILSLSVRPRPFLSSLLLVKAVHFLSHATGRRSPRWGPGVYYFDPPTWSSHRGLVVGVFDCGPTGWRSKSTCVRALWLPPPPHDWVNKGLAWYVQPCLCDWVIKDLGMSSRVCVTG